MGRFCFFVLSKCLFWLNDTHSYTVTVPYLYTNGKAFTCFNFSQKKRFLPKRSQYMQKIRVGFYDYGLIWVNIKDFFRNVHNICAESAPYSSPNKDFIFGCLDFPSELRRIVSGCKHFRNRVPPNPATCRSHRDSEFCGYGIISANVKDLCQNVHNICKKSAPLQPI